ncbi:MAG: NHL repeat-containing protein, partial [Elusimicrobiota bacterium]
MIFDAEGRLLRRLGTGKTALGNEGFNSPGAVNIDSLGNIYVADSWNHRVQLFDAKGGYLDSLRGVGDDAAFDEPIAVAAGASGDVFIADSRRGCVDSFVMTALKMTAGLDGYEPVMRDKFIGKIEGLVRGMGASVLTFIFQSYDTEHAIGILQRFLAAVPAYLPGRRKVIMSRDLESKMTAGFLKDLTAHEAAVLTRLEYLNDPQTIDLMSVGRVDDLMTKDFVRADRELVRAIWGVVTLGVRGRLDVKRVTDALYVLSETNARDFKALFNSLAWDSDGRYKDFEINAKLVWPIDLAAILQSMRQEAKDGNSGDTIRNSDSELRMVSPEKAIDSDESRWVSPESPTTGMVRRDDKDFRARIFADLKFNLKVDGQMGRTSDRDSGIAALAAKIDALPESESLQGFIPALRSVLYSLQEGERPSQADLRILLAITGRKHSAAKFLPYREAILRDLRVLYRSEFGTSGSVRGFSKLETLGSIAVAAVLLASGLGVWELWHWLDSVDWLKVFIPYFWSSLFALPALGAVIWDRFQETGVHNSILSPNIPRFIIDKHRMQSNLSGERLPFGSKHYAQGIDPRSIVLRPSGLGGNK